MLKDATISWGTDRSEMIIICTAPMFSGITAVQKINHWNFYIYNGILGFAALNGVLLPKA